MNSKMSRTALFTTSSSNYLPFGNTLLESVKKFHTDIDLYYLLVDEPNEIETYLKEDLYTLCVLKDIGVPDYHKMAFAYTIIEFNTAVKPFFFKYLFEKGYQKVLYLDPDILVYSSMDIALNILDNHSIVVTPHQLLSLGKVNHFKRYMDWEQSALETGIFNLGFIGVTNNEEGKNFIQWWGNRCNFFCYVEPERGLFVDQKWLNLAPCYFPTLCILRHKGYNMAPWNLHERMLFDSCVNGNEPLVFYHFSSIEIENENGISKHISAVLSERKDLVAIYSDYRHMIKANGWKYLSNQPYAYNKFTDGENIEILHRRLYAHIFNSNIDPFAIPSKQFIAVIKNEYSKLVKTEKNDDKLIIKGIKICLKFFLQVGGAHRYYTLISTAKAFNDVRNHEFLLK